MLDSNVSEDEVLQELKDLQVRHFHSAFQFLDAHKGPRRGCYSVFCGTTGCGKSGLVQAVAVQVASTPKKKVLIILTEESKNNYAGPMLVYSKMTGGSMSNITFFEESSMDHPRLKTHDQYLAALKDVIISSFADYVVIDNGTTGRFYGNSTANWDQEKSIWMIKNLAKDIGIHISVVSHASKNVTDNMARLMTSQDHQGASSLGKEASFFYALQKFTNNGQTHVFLRTLKHRGYPDAHGTYLLRYDREIRLYLGDQKVDFEKLKETFKLRDTLGAGK